MVQTAPFPALTRFVLALLACALVVVVLAEPKRALACSPRPIAPAERLDVFADSATAVVVGEVMSEERNEESGLYRSGVRVAATLAGEPPETFEVGRLGFPLECGSGPRLQDGAQVLLFATEAPGVGAVRDLGWRIAALGQGVYLIEDGQADYFGAFADPPEREPVGDAAGLIRRAGGVLGSDADDVKRAIAFANGDRTLLAAVPPDRLSNPLVLWGAGAVVVLAVVILGRWQLRQQRARA